jgi:hypothetical protein
MTIYVILGTRECVYQDRIDEAFVPHPTKEVVTAFTSYEKANQFLLTQHLKTPKHQSHGDTSYYKDGFYDMEIQGTELDES